MGYSLPAFPWYIDQSIGGAVSTGTHGSSFRYGSLSSQVSFWLLGSVISRAVQGPPGTMYDLTD